MATVQKPAVDTAFKLASAAFAAGATIPADHTCDGSDISPALEWSDPPQGTKSFALICYDPDARAGTWVHWVLYAIPGATRSLRAGVPKNAEVPGVGRQGMNDFKKVGYGGPAPPAGMSHRYFFRLVALDTDLHLAPRLKRSELERKIAGHELGSTELMGRYERKAR